MANRDIFLVGGRAYSHEVILDGNEGGPWVFGDDDTFKAQIRKTADAPTVMAEFAIQKTEEAVIASLTASQTMALEQSGVWDLVWYPEGDPERATEILSGKALWTRGVTRDGV